MRPSISDTKLNLPKNISKISAKMANIYIIASLALLCSTLPLLMLVKLDVIGVDFALLFFALITGASFSFLFFIRKNIKSDTKQILSNKNWQNLFESLNDGFLQFNSEGEIKFISNSVRQLLNCQNYELAGSGFFERVHIVDRPLYLTSLKRAQFDGEKIAIDIRLRKDDFTTGGTIANFIWVKIEFLPIKENGNKPYQLIAILNDISTQRQKEDKADAGNKDEANEKSRFLAIMGHELKTPLNAIIGFSDMLANERAGELEPKQIEYANIIKQSSNHLLQIVNSLLDMAKIEAGKFELNKSRFLPEKLLSQSLNLVSKNAKEKNINIKVETSDNLVQILADERACLQIIVNLLSNAIKFSKPNSSVFLSLNRRANYLEIMVKDSGIGIDKKHIKRLGEPFFQVDNANDRNYEGTGLGISIVKALVELHQGRINIESRLNIGTNIRVLLPINGVVNKQNKENISFIASDKAQTSHSSQYQKNHIVNNKRLAL